jgi:putative transposase
MRYAWIEEHRDAFGIARMCGLLEVSRSGYCQWRERAPSDRARSNAALDAAVSKLHA